MQQPNVQAPPMYVEPQQPSTMGTEQAHMPPGQGLGFPTVDRPPLMQPSVEEGEPLLFGIRDDPPSYMQAAPTGRHEDYTMDLDDPVQAQLPQPLQPHLALQGPPPTPAGYEPHGPRSQTTGYLAAAQGVPYGVVYSEEAAPQVGNQKLNNPGVNPPKWDENKQALTKWFQEMILFPS